jgi:tRNA(Ile)-lysidine synthase
MNEQQIFRKVEQAIQAHDMFQSKDAVLVGVSGGPDSMALLHILIRLAPKWDLTIGAAHLDHRLRDAESKQDAQFVAALCKRLHLPFFIQTRDVAAFQKKNKISIEMAGRHARYRFYDQAAKKGHFNKIALGHHADDNAELILMNLLRGSGPLGIAGIPPIRDHRFVRPLIYLRRDEILYILEKNNIAYLIDPSNTDVRYLRNRIRHQLLPELARFYNPKIADALNRFAHIAGAEEDWFNSQIQSVFADIAKTVSDRVQISIADLSGIHMALQRRVLRKAIQHVKGDLKKITYQHIDAVCHIAHKDSDENRADLPGGLVVERKNDRLLIFKQTPARLRKKSRETVTVPFYQYLIYDPLSQPQPLLIQEAGFQIRWSTVRMDDLNVSTIGGQAIACFDMDKIMWPLMVRSFQHGDRFYPLGMNGSQKLKKFFINNKIPRDERQRIPIVVNRGEILWVAGYRMGEAAKITDKTQNILKIELLLA